MSELCVRSHSTQEITDDMRTFMSRVRSKVAIAVVGGSDLHKIEEQMRGTGRSDYDLLFAENGLTAFHGTKEFETQVSLHSITFS